jgi:putative hydrolase of the HAD superfamily
MTKAILFDLDGTLYRSDIIRQKFAEAAYNTIARLRNISLESAHVLVEERRAELQKAQGSGVPYTLTLRSLGIPIEQWHRENIAFFDPRDYLNKDETLKRVLATLKKQYRLAVLTNNNDVQTERILEALDLHGVFDHVFTYNTFKLLKPDPEFFKKAVTALNVRPTECLVVGDRFAIDLTPARELGMQILEVTGPDDIYTLGSGLEI